MRSTPDAILNALPAHVAVLDAQGKICRVNKAWRAFAAQNGLEPAQVDVGTNYLSVCDAATGEGEEEGKYASIAIKEILRGELGSYRLEYACHSPRTKRWFMMQVAPVMLDGALHAVVMHHDVTEQRELEERFQLLLHGTANHIGTGFYSALVQHLAQALDARFAFVGECSGEAKTHVRILAAWADGKPGELFEYDVKGTPCENVMQGRVCRVSERVQEHYPQDTMLVGMGAASYLGIPIVNAAGEVIGLVAVVDTKPMAHGNHAAELIRIFAARAGAEIERQATQRALETAQQQQALILEMADDGIVTVDEKQRVLLFNRGAEHIFGYTSAEIVGESIDRLIPERFLPGHRGHVKHFGESGVTARPMGARGQILGRRKDGREFPAEASISQVIHSGKRLFTAIVRDVSQRAEAERKLAQSEATWRAVVDNAPAYVAILDRAGQIRFVNRSESPTLTREQISGRNVFELVPPEFVQPVRDALLRVFEKQETATLKISAPGQSGALRWYAVRVGPIVHEGRVESAVWIGTNITEQQSLEDQLRQSQKMEAVGRLAGGVAHDFNNLLTVISGHAELMAAKPRSTGEASHARQIIEASRRAADLTRQLLAFSRKQVLQPRRINLNEVVADSAKLLARLIGEDVVLKTTLTPDLDSVLADPTQIDQVLMNLAINARDAMPRGGSLSIETCNIEITQDYASRHEGVKAGPHVRLSVSDTGEGMDADTLSRAFEPFFTTKAQGKGTGLGLATVHGIVKQSGGHVFVYSEPGRGSCFKLFFPVDQGPPQPHRRPSAPIPQTRGTERILLVEDDAAVRALARDVLTEQGHEVIATGSPTEALELCKDPHAAYDLLLTDVIMPGIGGRALAEQMQRQHPKLKVLFVSGYTDDAIVHHGILNEGVNFLQKPFDIGQLAAKVREVLDAAPG